MSLKPRCLSYYEVQVSHNPVVSQRDSRRCAPPATLSAKHMENDLFLSRDELDIAQRLANYHRKIVDLRRLDAASAVPEALTAQSLQQT